ncbi:NADH-quinone oxidoreductase subunit NuoE [bacterium]|nr:NADH-quinone oxidoreductase subunit NuoE [bacterium]
MHKTKTVQEPLRNFAKVKEIIEKYGTERSALIPVLQAIQGEFRYLPQEMLSFVATAMGIPQAEVFGVATFYAQFSTQPKGKHIVQVCDGTACHVRGASDIIKKFKKDLQIPEGKTTTDDLYVTLETVSCLGACALAPAVVVDGKVYGNVNFEDVARIIVTMKESDDE